MSAVTAPASVDPWSADGLALRHPWPVWVAVGIGSSYALVWLSLGRPSLHVTRWVLPIGLVVGVVWALVGPNNRRGQRFALSAGFALLVLCSYGLVAGVGELLLGTDRAGRLVVGVLVDVAAVAFFGGAMLVTAKVRAPGRRLPDPILAQLGRPAASRRKPRKVTVRCRDGSQHDIVVVEGGFVAGWHSPVRPDDVVEVVKGG
jgi:hypothetical protein